jgi:hypothetical protein
MDRIGPNKIDREREALRAQIRAAFKGVTRDGGVSWSETLVIDNYGTDEERAAARARDTDTCWTELVDDPNWVLHDGLGGFSFVDAIGFRYYLPAAMIRSVESGDDHGSLCFHLTLPPPGDKFHDWKMGKWSRIDRKQRLAVRRFIRYMEATDPHFGACWREAFESYWKNV